jgi:hypothetical protein
MSHETTERLAEIATMHLSMMARNCVYNARTLRTTLDALELYVEQFPHYWQIHSRTGVTRSLPMGSGQLDWDRSQYPDVETAFQAALTHAWDEMRASQP